MSDTLGMNVTGGYVFAGGSLGRRSIRNTSPRQINPRIGLVYELNAKTVIWTGFGIFSGLPSYAANSAYTSNAFQSSTPWLATLNGITVNATLSNPLPNGYNFSNGSKDGLLSQIGQGLSRAIPDTLVPVYNQQWNFNIQRSLGRDMLFETAYAGNKGTHLALSSQLDQLRSEQLALWEFAASISAESFLWNRYCGRGGQTPDSTGVNADLGSKRTIDRWFDTSQFLQPKDFTFGNTARSTAQLRNANARNLDFSLFKTLQIVERLRAELRGEAFNLTNTPLFGNPGTTLNTPIFGVVTSQENSPRQVHLGLKIIF